MSKDDAINTMKNSDLNEKSGSLFIYLFFYYYILKWVKQLIIKKAEKQY